MYLDTGRKTECFGCESCLQICPKDAITLAEDDEGFRYPVTDLDRCVHCVLCREVCPHEHMPQQYENNKFVFGGYHRDPDIRFESTSGGAFSAIVDAFCDENYVIFGAEAKGLRVFHSCITDKRDLFRFRKSKYSQSIIGDAYRKAKQYLCEDKKVLFSGTPCQIAGLLCFLGDTDREKLLTVEVVCEGVPSPLYVRKLEQHLAKRYGAPIESIDYRFTDRSLFSYGKWDFQVMRIALQNRGRLLKKDRWFNPFWSVWLNHLMSRPACYQCPFTTKGRVADLTLGDLWGVHIYCPELYGHNGGASLAICNTEKGKAVFSQAQKRMYGHELAFEDALKYQGPMRRPIAENPERSAFMCDLQSDMDYVAINRKWAKPPAFKLLVSKYLWGNRQKVFLWSIKEKLWRRAR